MAVAHDAASESHTGSTGSASEASFTFSHNPVGTPRAALVFVLTILATPKDTGVTYDGQAMTLVSGGEANDTAGEPGTIRTYFLDNVPATDPANVVVSRTNDATVMYAVCATVTAAGAVEVTGIVLLEEQGTFVEQNVDDGSPGTNSVRYAFGYYGGASPPPQGANSTLLFGIDFTAFGANFVRRTSAGQGSLAVGFTQATSDDRAGVHLAIREVPPLTVSPGLLTQAVSAVAPSQMTQQVVPGLASQLASMIAPNQVSQQVAPGLSSQLLGEIAPTIIADQFISPELMSQLVAGLAPNVVQRVDPGLISQAASPTTPAQIGQAIAPGLLSQLLAAIAPDSVHQAVAAVLISQFATTVAPAQIAQSVAPTLLVQLVIVLDPMVQQGGGGQTVSPGLLSALLAPVAPTVISVQVVAPDLMAQLLSLQAPVVISGLQYGKLRLADGTWVTFVLRD